MTKLIALLASGYLLAGKWKDRNKTKAWFRRKWDNDANNFAYADTIPEFAHGEVPVETGDSFRARWLNRLIGIVAVLSWVTVA